MREKNESYKQEVDGVQRKLNVHILKRRNGNKPRNDGFYKKYDINPMKSALGCLPVLIQMPVVMGLYCITLPYWWRYCRTSSFYGLIIT